MKTTFKTALKTAVVAAALAYAGASHAAYTATSNFGGTFSNPSTSASFGADHGTVGVAVYDVTDGVHNYFAFCIDPTTPIATGASYLAKTVSVSDSVKRLYETSYATLANNTSNTAAFQLALWELTSDDANLTATTGAQYFSGVIGTTSINKLNLAKGMLASALDTTIALKGEYSYVQFSYAPDTTKSQTLLAVTSAVPEADAWAMMGVGLGLIGLMGRRRKSAQTEKFA